MSSIDDMLNQAKAVLRKTTEDVATSAAIAAKARARESIGKVVAEQLDGLFGSHSAAISKPKGLPVFDGLAGSAQRQHVEEEYEEEEEEEEEDTEQDYDCADSTLLFAEDTDSDTALSFDTVSDTDGANMIKAVAVWQELAKDPETEVDKLVVAWHITANRAIVGQLSPIFSYMEHNDLPLHVSDEFEGLPEAGIYRSELGWRLTRDPEILENIEIDRKTLSNVVQLLKRSTEAKVAKTKFNQEGTASSKFKDFHWGAEAKVVSAIEIPGMLPNAQLFLLGVTRNLLLFGGAGSPDDKYVEFSADKGFPAIYGVGSKDEDRVLLIYGIKKYISELVGKRELADARAKQQYMKMSGKSASKVYGTVPGSSVVPIALAKRICYGSLKGDEFVEYYHDFGENTKEYPVAYLLEDDSILIHGANMVIEPRGVVE
jgi:hypothetical protein